MKNLIVFLNALPRFSLNIKMPLFVKSSDDHLGGLYYLLTNEIQCLILFTLMYQLEYISPQYMSVKQHMAEFAMKITIILLIVAFGPQSQ